MLWFFAKQDAWLHYEIRRHVDGDDYELVITHADGRQDIERYVRSSDVVARSRHLEESLAADGWQVPENTGRTSARDSTSTPIYSFDLTVTPGGRKRIVPPNDSSST
jgi:hypothetical protein